MKFMVASDAEASRLRGGGCGGSKPADDVVLQLEDDQRADKAALGAQLAAQQQMMQLAPPAPTMIAQVEQPQFAVVCTPPPQAPPPPTYGYDVHGSGLEGVINGRYARDGSFNGAARYKQTGVSHTTWLLYQALPNEVGAWVITGAPRYEDRPDTLRRDIKYRAFSDCSVGPPLSGWFVGQTGRASAPILTPFGVFPDGSGDGPAIDKFGGVTPTVRVSGAGAAAVNGLYERRAPEQVISRHLPPSPTFSHLLAPPTPSRAISRLLTPSLEAPRRVRPPLAKARSCCTVRTRSAISLKIASECFSRRVGAALIAQVERDDCI